MENNFQMKGEWFLPTDKTHRLYGTLTFDRLEGIELELYGCLEGDSLCQSIKDQKIILGLTSESKLVTLYNCSMTKASGMTLVSGQESGKPISTYSIRYLLVGLHVDSDTDLRFNKITAKVFNLDEWIGISGFNKLKLFEKSKMVVEYELPKDIEFEIDSNTKGRFVFIRFSSGLNFFQKKVTISQDIKFQAICENEETIEKLIEYIFKFQNFLILALYRATYPLSILLSGEKHQDYYDDGKSYRKIIELFFSSANFKIHDKPLIPQYMIFDYHKIKSIFPKIIKNWYLKYELLEPSFDLVFEQFYNPNIFGVNKFLNLAQAAETFHARIHNHKKIPREDYKKMKEDILKIAPKEYHPWLNEQFNFGNNLNLHKRLTELIENYSNSFLDLILGDKEKFVLDIKNSRNYYTHYSQANEKKSLKGADLFYISQKLKILLVCGFLIELGVDKENVSKFLNNCNYRFSHLINR